MIVEREEMSALFFGERIVGEMSADIISEIF